MSTTPTIAAIIPLYNGMAFIERSLKSVLSQTRSPDEILVVDDGSTDNGAQLALNIAGNIKAFRLLRKRNGGQSAARNYGVRASASSLIAFLDQDDGWYPDHLKMLAKPFGKKQRRLGWVYSNLDTIDREGRMVTSGFLPVSAIHPKTSIFHCVDRDMMVLPSASLISREAFEAVGGFDERLIGYEDDDLFLRMFRAGFTNQYIDRPLSEWRIYPSSTSYSPHMARSRGIYMQKLIDSFPDEIEHDRYWARDLIAPRFGRNFLTDAYKGIRCGRKESVDAALPALDLVASKSRLGAKLRLKLFILPLLRQYWFMRILYRMGILSLVRRAVR